MLASLFSRIVEVFYFYYYINLMYIVATGWLYVVLMMSITETSVIAGIMTLLMYGVLPLAIIWYVVRAPHRARLRKKREQMQAASKNLSDAPE